MYQDPRVRDWSALSVGDRVVVTEPGRPGCRATVDTKTADSTVVWVVDDGGQRRAFDHREGIDLVALPELATTG